MKFQFGTLAFFFALWAFIGYGVFCPPQKFAPKKSSEAREDLGALDSAASSSRGLAAAVNWAQPPVGCAEEMIPSLPKKECPDLTDVENVWKDWPSDISPEEKTYWNSRRRHLTYCRATEQLRREEANPGSQDGGKLELAWMHQHSVENYDRKVNVVYRASNTYGVPPQVLVGALYQESLFMELGIANDGGNFSCGIGQVNVVEWCHWANKQSEEKKDLMNWPSSPVDCDSGLISPELVSPFYQIAKSRLGGQPEYKLLKKHFAGITLPQVINGFPAASEQTQKLRFQAVRSFIDNCSDVDNGIMAKANELANLYQNFVPETLKRAERYAEGERFRRNCQQQIGTNAYPLHSGWLAAVAAYNAGPRSFEAMAHYYRWTQNDLRNPAIWNGFNGKKMVEGLYWGGKYNPSTDQIDYIGLDGSRRSWGWYKACVVQRHVARVVQHVTLLPDFFIDTLEGAFPCKKSIIENGKLISSGVPVTRQKSSGVVSGAAAPADANNDPWGWDAPPSKPVPPTPPAPPPKKRKPVKNPNPWDPFGSNFWE